MPKNTLAEGVVWIPEGALVRVAADGFVVEVVCADGESVQAGEPLLRCEDPELEARVAKNSATLAELRARYTAVEREDRVAAAQLRDQLAEADEEREHLAQRRTELTVRAPLDGVFVLSRTDELLGSFLSRGEILAHVIDEAQVVVRVVLPQQEVDELSEHSKGAAVRLVQRPERTYEARISRRVPASRRQLPSEALGKLGGGEVAVAMDGQHALEGQFEFELSLLDAESISRVGGRVHARFVHPWEPYGPRLYRQVRRVFLSRFDI